MSYLLEKINVPKDLWQLDKQQTEETFTTIIIYYDMVHKTVVLSILLVSMPLVKMS